MVTEPVMVNVEAVPSPHGCVRAESTYNWYETRSVPDGGASWRAGAVASLAMYVTVMVVFLLCVQVTVKLLAPLTVLPVRMSYGPNAIVGADAVQVTSSAAAMAWPPASASSMPVTRMVDLMAALPCTRRSRGPEADRRVLGGGPRYGIVFFFPPPAVGWGPSPPPTFTGPASARGEPP